MFRLRVVITRYNSIDYTSYMRLYFHLKCNSFTPLCIRYCGNRHRLVSSKFILYIYALLMIKTLLKTPVV